MKNLDNLSGISVLLVEDDVFNRRFIKRTLENLQATVCLASNGQEAIDSAQLKQVDLILMDLQMPVMDGFEAIQYLKEEIHLSTPIIALTGSELAADKEKALGLGCIDYLVKPLNGEALLKAIQRTKNNTEEKAKAIKESNGVEEELYSLVKLEEIARGNQAFVTKMVLLFLEELPEYLSNLKQALEELDYDRIKAVAHKMKPSVNLMDMSSIGETIQQLEDNAGAKTNLDQIPTLAQQVIKVGEQVEEALNKDFR